MCYLIQGSALKSTLRLLSYNNSRAIRLVMSSEFARKQGFKLKKIKRLIYVRNVDSSFNKKRPIEHTVKINIYYQEHRKRTEIDMIGEQKWSVILGMLWLAHHNPEIDWRTGEVKMMSVIILNL